MTTSLHTLARRAGTALATGAVALAAQAHPGHGEHDTLGLLATLVHPLQPAQALWALLVSAAVAATVSEVWPRSRRLLGWLLLSAAGAGGLALLARG
jgi:hydrogenase/urease accessory protein HupE